MDDWIKPEQDIGIVGNANFGEIDTLLSQIEI